MTDTLANDSPKLMYPIASALTAVMLIAAATFAGTIRHDVEDSLYAALAADTAYDAVGQVTWREDGQNFQASATYIGDGWVLTAAHVVEGTDFTGSGVTNWTFTVEDVSYQADEWYIHPEWTAASGVIESGADVGLVKLIKDVSGIEPAWLYDGSVGSELGQVVTMVGYGATGDGLTGAGEPAGTKRAGQNMVDLIGGTRIGPLRRLADSIMIVDFDDPNTAVGLPRWRSSTNPLDLEYLIAPGDSGGGVFVAVEGNSYLAGVSSFIQSFDGTIDSDYGDLAGLIRVSQFEDWIFEVTGITPIPEEIPSIPGDLDGDDDVDFADFSVLASNFTGTLPPAMGSKTAAEGDFNGDGDVDIGDFSIITSSFTGTLTAPVAAAIAAPVPDDVEFVASLLDVQQAVTVGAIGGHVDVDGETPFDIPWTAQDSEAVIEHTSGLETAPMTVIYMPEPGTISVLMFAGPALLRRPATPQRNKRRLRAAQ